MLECEAWVASFNGAPEANAAAYNEWMDLWPNLSTWGSVQQFWAGREKMQWITEELIPSINDTPAASYFTSETVIQRDLLPFHVAYAGLELPT